MPPRHATALPSLIIYPPRRPGKCGGLDRYGLELLVLAADGIAAVRLAFPAGPVACLDDLPASLRTALTCRCQAGPGDGQRPGRPAPGD